MKFFDLKKKTSELLDAGKSESKILKKDETVIKKTLFEVRREFYQLKLQREKNDNLEKEDKSLTEKFNELEQEFFIKTNAKNLEKDEKISQLVKICIPMTETIAALKETRNKLKQLKNEMSDNEFDKKSELLLIWKEIKWIYEIEDIESELELEIYESVNSTVDFEDSTKDMVEELRKEIKEESEKKSGFLGKIFSKK